MSQTNGDATPVAAWIPTKNRVAFAGVSVAWLPRLTEPAPLHAFLCADR